MRIKHFNIFTTRPTLKRTDDASEKRGTHKWYYTVHDATAQQNLSFKNIVCFYLNAIVHNVETAFQQAQTVVYFVHKIFVAVLPLRHQGFVFVDSV